MRGIAYVHPVVHTETDRLYFFNVKEKEEMRIAEMIHVSNESNEKIDVKWPSEEFEMQRRLEGTVNVVFDEDTREIQAKVKTADGELLVLKNVK